MMAPCKGHIFSPYKGVPEPQDVASDTDIDRDREIERFKE
jgi:hypothetical protein